MTTLYFLPIIATLIGWATNYIAVKMLFRPKKATTVLFMTFHGVFPKRQSLLAQKLGEVVANELFSAEDVKSHLAEKAPETIKHLIDSQLDTFLTEKLPKAIPMASMFLTPDLIQKVKSEINQGIDESTPELVDKFSSNLVETLHVEETVKQKVETFSPEKLEELLFSIMKKEFKFIEFIGALLGFFIGILQIGILKLGV